MKCNCIIAGVDLGHATEKILAYSACFSTGLKAPVRLLYVIDFILTPPAYLMPYIEEERKREETELRRWQAELEHNGVTSDSRIMMGRLHESFVRAIEEYSPGLIVIGYKSHVLRPSSSERLIKSLAVPMLVVRGQKSDNASTGSVRIGKVLCAVDFSEGSVKALKTAEAYSRAFSADMNVVHVVPMYGINDTLEQLDRGERERFEGQMKDEAEQAMSDTLRDAGIGGRGLVLQGNPVEMICSLAAEGGYDLIVLGARGLSYVKGLFIGSTTESVLKSAPCPVLIVH